VPNYDVHAKQLMAKFLEFGFENAN